MSSKYKSPQDGTPLSNIPINMNQTFSDAVSGRRTANLIPESKLNRSKLKSSKMESSQNHQTTLRTLKSIQVGIGNSSGG